MLFEFDLNLRILLNINATVSQNGPLNGFNFFLFLQREDIISLTFALKKTEATSKKIKSRPYYLFKGKHCTFVYEKDVFSI